MPDNRNRVFLEAPIWESRPEFQLMPKELATALAPHIHIESDPGTGSFPAISLAGIELAATHWTTSRRKAMTALLKLNVWPMRFSRNRGVFAAGEQAKLLASGAAVIGCGGLGGYVATLLARLGAGKIVLCDYDVFDESNLNRQLLASENNLGRNKAIVAGEELQRIASHVEVRVYPVAAEPDNLPDMLQDVDIVIDCLDSVMARMQTEKAAHAMGLPYIHGAIAGQEGFAMISRPAGTGLQALYGKDRLKTEDCAERKSGSPTLTPAALATLETALAVQELLGTALQETVLWHLDLSCFHLEAIRWP